eukprot:TRINITY_DN4221_c0_g1_i2.p5 TRINITY_DN4221_c0_g1~~TRINITY_DN4221_c0_g1_i2.p5  ORF type:complete len:114 (+),score=3.17 TRINITY_DN4221_c0_g1_i2:306-647(+)
MGLKSVNMKLFVTFLLLAVGVLAMVEVEKPMIGISPIWKECRVNIFCKRMCFAPKGEKECGRSGRMDSFVSYSNSEVICMCGCRYRNMCVAIKSGAQPCMPIKAYYQQCRRPY